LLKRNATLPSAAAEVAYSLLDGCERFKYDADVELFRRIAAGDIAEGTFIDQMIMTQKLKFALLIRYAAKEGRVNTVDGGLPDLSPTQLVSRLMEEAQLSVDDIMEVVQGFFPSKALDAFPLIRTALESEARTPSQPLNIAKLFQSNEYGNQGPFIEAIRDQHLDEVCVHVAEVADVIANTALRPSSSASSVVDGETRKPTNLPSTTKEGEATIESVRNALHELDPTKPSDHVHRYLQEVLECYHYRRRPSQSKRTDEGSDTFSLNDLVDCQELAEASKKVFCKRFGRGAVRPTTGLS
jgi:hypothetical protein